MTCVIVNDACCLIDLQKGRLIEAFLALPYRFVIPLPVFEDELLSFSDEEKAQLLALGLEIHDLPGEAVGRVVEYGLRYTGLSAYDRFCLVSMEYHEDSLLLTGDRLLRDAAHAENLQFHGVLWVIDQLAEHEVCDTDLLSEALNIWQEDPAVRLPVNEIENRLSRFV